MINIYDTYIPTYMDSVALAHMNRQDQFWYNRIFHKVKAAKRSGKFIDHSKSNFLRIPNQKIGPTSTPNLVVWSVDGQEYVVDDYGLAGLTSMSLIMTADNPVEPFETTAKVIGSGIMLGREQRGYELLTTAANYDASKVETLTGGQRFDTDTAKPYRLLKQMCSKVFDGCTHIIMSTAVWDILSSHDDMRGGVYGSVNAAPVGGVEIMDLAKKLRVKDIYVHETWYDSSAEGADPDVKRLWADKGISFLHLDHLGGRNALSFCQCFEHVPMMSTHWKAHDLGPGGSWKSFMWNVVAEKVTSTSCGAYLATVIS